MATRKRTRTQIVADRAKIAGMYLRGVSQYTIAGQLGITREMVTYDMAAVREEWRKSAVSDLNQARHQELARIDEIERENWIAWEASKTGKEVTTTRQRRKGLTQTSQSGQQMDVPMEQVNEAGRRTETRDPNPQFMEKIQWCVEMRCKILGLFAPTELRHTGAIATITEVFYEPLPNSREQRLVVLGGGRHDPPPLALVEDQGQDDPA